MHSPPRTPFEEYPSGHADHVGDLVGLVLGDADGEVDGAFDGLVLGLADGLELGLSVGEGLDIISLGGSTGTLSQQSRYAFSAVGQHRP